MGSESIKRQAESKRGQELSDSELFSPCTPPKPIRSYNMNLKDIDLSFFFGAKGKSQSQDCCVTLNPKTNVEILLSAHARTSQADILHLDQKAVKSTSGKRVSGKF